MADLVKGPIVGGPEGAARELKDMLEALEANVEGLTFERNFHRESVDLANEEIAGLKARIAQLEVLLDGRDAFIASQGLWGEFVDQLPRALAEPRA